LGARNLRYGVCSTGGALAGHPKTNQDGFFLYEKARSSAAAGDGAADFVCGVVDGHGHHGHHVSGLSGAK